MPDSSERSIPFNRLAPGISAMRGELDAAIDRVLTSGWLILGPETVAFEEAFAHFHGEDYQAVGVGSGTDALWIGLRALGVKDGDEVLVVANAGVPPVAAVVAAGARPVFCDVDPSTHTLEPAEIARKATPATRAVLVVHLYGQAADMDPIVAEAHARGLVVLEDCAQAHGALYKGRKVGTLGDAGAFSFYPTKNLGALGDGGAVVTRNREVADRARLLRQYGWRQKYMSEVHSTVTRLDELQAAILQTRLPHLGDWNSARRSLARIYNDRLAGLPSLDVPVEASGREHVYHLYVIQTALRDSLREQLAACGISTDVHYPLPAHLQKPYLHYGDGPASLPHTERLAREILSLPLYPEMPLSHVEYVVEQIRSRLGAAVNV